MFVVSVSDILSSYCSVLTLLSSMNGAYEHPAVRPLASGYPIPQQMGAYSSRRRIVSPYILPRILAL